MDPLYWRLIYADGHHEDEALDNTSIRMARPGALLLVACRPEAGPEGRDFRKPITRVNLFDEGVIDGRAYAPVWYRKRSMPVLLDDSQRHAERPRLDITVFGRMREGEHTVEGRLWASLDGCTVIDCPEWAIDQGVIEGLAIGR